MKTATHSVTWHWRRAATAFVLVSAIFAGELPAQERESTEQVHTTEDSRPDHRGGQLRLGAFWVNNIRSSVFVGRTDGLLGVRIDAETDFGLGNSLVSPRAAFNYRFGRRSGISASFYDFSLDGRRSLAREIQIGDTLFEVDTEIDSAYDATYFKLAYDLIVYDDENVTATFVTGLHVSDFSISAAQRASERTMRESGASTTAPLPVIGGALRIRIAPRLDFVVRSDFFLLNKDSQRGSLRDTYILFEHATLERFSFGTGFNVFDLNVDFTKNDLLWDFQSNYTALYAYMAVNF